ncbi:MAG TPA: TatD family hydrolase [Chitinophagaceae bacterium]|nr:TatD family hydrolase [Chitinophagaceae bacterium]
MIIDTHSHIYLPEFRDDLDQMLTRAENEAINLILMPAIDNETHQSMLEIEAQYPGKSLSMMGLHPCSVKEGYKQELKIVEEYLEKRRFVAVGETGLDFYWDRTFTKEQYASFQIQIELAKQYNIPVVIHSRNSIDDCIKVIRENQQGNLKGVFHCFSGNEQQAKEIIALGFYLGIGGVVTFKNSGLDKVMVDIDIKNIVLETDAPYLAPVPFRGKRNECSYLRYVVEKLAQIKNIAKEEVAKMTTKNAKELFSI